MPSRPSLGTSKERRAKLTQVLQSIHRDEDCDACVSSLDKYVAAQIEGKDYLELFPDVALHLDSCVNCSEIYSRLYELEVAEKEGVIPEPQSIPRPDLAFLAQKHMASPTDKLSELLDQLLRRGKEFISIQLSSQLISLLKPSATQIAMRSKDVGERYSEVIFEFKSDRLPELNIPFSVTAYRDAQQEEFCLVEVKINFPGRDWPNLGGRTVQLIVGETKREMLTDPGGVASFEEVPISDLEKVKVEVKL